MKRRFIMIGLCLILAVVGHAFFLYELMNGRYMTGNGDGISQMLPFKKMLYDEYVKGNFFYSYRFGLGGGIYTQLGYYFTTSTVFIITSLIVWILSLVHLIQSTDIHFWANAVIWLSIIKLTIIIYITYLVLMGFVHHKLAAFTGACLYGLSIIYFRHQTFWEFFTDSMIWLPLLVLGVERIFRDGRPTWFIIACSLTLINNFYFAYIHMIFLLIYIGFRYLIKLGFEERGWKVFWTLAISSILSFGISIVFFIPSVYGFLNNLRPSYEQRIPWFQFHDHLLFTSRVYLLPVIFLICMFLVPLYRNRLFFMFASISFLFVLFHFSPKMASVFNGFSAPQYRFEYILAFTVGALVAITIKELQAIEWKWRKRAVIGAWLVFVLSVLLSERAFRHLDVVALTGIGLLLISAIFLWMNVRSQRHIRFFSGALLIFSLITAGVYQKSYLSENSGIKQLSSTYLKSEAYAGEEQTALIDRIQKREKDPLTRIDWMNGVRNNTPLFEGFNGMSVYSSILNQHLLRFYWTDLQIDMGRESVSRYATMGDRSNLYSLTYGKYYMRKKSASFSPPAGFKPIMESEHYVVYENTRTLPFARTTSTVYSEESLKKASVLEKEHAMLQGVILPTKGNAVTKTIPDRMKDANLHTKQAIYHNGKLEVLGKTGGLNITLPDDMVKGGDVYASFYIKRVDRNQGFQLSVDQYVTSRKSNTSIYKTGVNDVTIRVPAQKTLSIRLPQGTYELDKLKLYPESYEVLNKEFAKEKQDHGKQQVKMTNQRLSIFYDNQKGDRYMVIPVPFEKGWELTVNGKKQNIEKANYAFIGFPIEKGQNQIVLTYYPPFIRPLLLISVISLVLAVIYGRHQSKRKRKTPLHP
ncbi:YfhO family protein [Bacillus sp. NPDC077027]|uniref:YfhO family protein n=1 Tax=Bacillus sp. NPDC077027 TaxID=3390548 RepID=UPI003D05FF13